MKHKLGPVSQNIDPPWLSKSNRSPILEVVPPSSTPKSFTTPRRHDDAVMSQSAVSTRQEKAIAAVELVVVDQEVRAPQALAAVSVNPVAEVKDVIEKLPEIIEEKAESPDEQQISLDLSDPKTTVIRPRAALVSLEKPQEQLKPVVLPTLEKMTLESIFKSPQQDAPKTDWSSVTELTMPSGDVIVSKPGSSPTPSYSNAGARRPFDASKKPGYFGGDKGVRRYIDPKTSARAKIDFEDLFSGRVNTPETAGPAMESQAVPTESLAPLAPTVQRIISLPNEAGSKTRVFQLSQGNKILPPSPVILAKPTDELQGLREIPQEKLDLSSLNARLGLMSVKQRLAWLLTTPENDLRPMSHTQAAAMTSTLLNQMSEEDFNELMPSSYWIHDPVRQIPFYSDGRYRIKPAAEDASVLPGGVGTWLSAHKLLTSETVKRSVNAQRIKLISLAGLVIASNRFETFQWMLAQRLNPLKPVAYLGCTESAQNKGHDIGEINGYALALVAHSTQFFSWAQQWQSILEEQAQFKAHELTSALSLGIKTWSAAHGELSQSCAEMTAVMLQLGAGISEWALRAFSPHGNNQAMPSVAWARFCAQTFSMDRKGLAAQRVIDSARSMGFSIRSKQGEPQEMTPFAQADLVDAVAMFLSHDFDPLVEDALGQTVLERARSARAQRVVALIEAHLRGEEVEQSEEAPTPIIKMVAKETVQAESPDQSEALRQAAQAAQQAAQAALLALVKEGESLQNLIDEMKETAKDIRELDHLIGMPA